MTVKMVVPYIGQFLRGKISSFCIYKKTAKRLFHSLSVFILSQHASNAAAAMINPILGRGNPLTPMDPITCSPAVDGEALLSTDTTPGKS